LQRDLVSRYLWPARGTTTPHPENVEQACSEHGFAPYRQNNGTRRRVYDIFPFMLELDWLEIRLRTLAPFVDYFVIVEFTTTFTGLPNPPILRDNWSRFKEFEDQILHFEVDDEVNSTDVWVHERFMKNAMLYKTFPTFVGTDHEAHEGDVIVVADVDEIPKPETMTLLRYCDFPERLTLRSHFYYYSFQWLHHGEQWAHPQATVYHGVNGTINPQDLRRGEGGVGSSLLQPLQRLVQKGNLWDAAWHCSSCFTTIKQVQAKMAAISHENWNTPENRDPKTIAERVRHGIDLFGRWGQNYDKVEDNRDVPQYVLENVDRFKYLVDRDGEDAAFVDYWSQI
jgi:beta-1,4-mannosyl-glycoprotein beta-1,4-N-acetylglucosaminyltransferase